MNFWNTVSVLSGVLLLLGGLYYTIGVLRARRAGHRVPMQRGLLTFGVGYMVYSVSLLLPRGVSTEASIAKTAGMLIAAVLIITGAVWLKQERDKIEGT